MRRARSLRLHVSAAEPLPISRRLHTHRIICVDGFFHRWFDAESRSRRSLRHRRIWRPFLRSFKPRLSGFSARKNDLQNGPLDSPPQRHGETYANYGIGQRHYAPAASAVVQRVALDMAGALKKGAIELSRLPTWRCGRRISGGSEGGGRCLQAVRGCNRTSTETAATRKKVK